MIDAATLKALAEIFGPGGLVMIGVVALIYLKPRPQTNGDGGKPAGFSAEQKLWLREEILDPILSRLDHR